MADVKNLKKRMEKMKQYNETILQERKKNIYKTDENRTHYTPLFSCYITELYKDHDESIVSQQIDINDYLKKLLDDLQIYFQNLD